MKNPQPKTMTLGRWPADAVLRGRKDRIWKFLWMLPGVGALYHLNQRRYLDPDQGARDPGTFTMTMKSLREIGVTAAEVEIGLALFRRDYAAVCRSKAKTSSAVRQSMEACAAISDAFWKRVIGILQREEKGKVSMG